MVPKKVHPPPKRFQKCAEKKGKKKQKEVKGGQRKVHKIVLQLFKVLKMVPMKVNSHKKSTQRSARKGFQKSPIKKY